MNNFNGQILKIVTPLGWLTICLLTLLEGKLLGEHVCQNEIMVPQETVQWELKNRTTRTYKWCMSVPPRCSVYSNSVINETRVAVINVTKSMEVCCEGYMEQNHFCVSLCQDCQNGLCIRGTCTCQNGWSGPRCDTLIGTSTTESVASNSGSTMPKVFTLTPKTFEEEEEEKGLLPTISESHPEENEENVTRSTTSGNYRVFKFTYNDNSTLSVLMNEDHEDFGSKPNKSPHTPEPPYVDTTVTESINIPSTENIELMAPSIERVESSLDYREMNNAPSAESTSKLTEIKLTTLMPQTVLAKPSTSENYDIISTGNNTVEDRFEKRSPLAKLSENPQLTLSEPTSKNVIYSVCAASLTTFLILVVVITFYAVRNSKKKFEKHKTKKDVATVAVYTASIFHSPLPDPPMFDNPTYLATKTNGNSWNHDKRESIEIQELNVVFEKPVANPKLDSKQYFYDHPPSTGSYRASSEIDTFSHYNLSQKSTSGIVLEPVYDEIPSNPGSVKEERSDLDSRVGRNADSNCLYVNTCGRTKF